MNLKPAEEWVDKSRNPNVVVSPAMRDLEIERIRQIQADALRYAAHLVDSWGHSSSAYNLQCFANQLDPRAET